MKTPTKTTEPTAREPQTASTSLSERDRAAKTAHARSGPRAGVRAYCSGHKWSTENAKNVGNW